MERFAGDDQPIGTPVEIAVVGMGPTGVSLLCDLLARLEARPPERRVALTLIDPAPALGPGYAFESPRILNMRARTMSMHARNPNHFHTWLEAERCVTESAAEFPPRALFGTYLTAILAESLASVDPQRIDIERWRARAIDVARAGESVRVTVAGGETRTFAAAVLAVGESRYQALHELTGRPRFVQSPWSPELREIPSGADVAVIGAGLSAVDACLDLLEQRHSGRVSCFARQRGLPKIQGPFERYEPTTITRRWLVEKTLGGRRELPLRTVGGALARELDHAMGMPYAAGSADAREWFSRGGRAARLQKTESEVFLEALEAASRGDTRWYYALDSLEELTPDVWNAIGSADQLRFLLRHRALWNEYRHSMPIPNGKALAGAIRGGQLEVRRGLSSVRSAATGRGSWEVTAGDHTRRYDYLIDATGGQPQLACEHDPLLRNCTARGSLTADARGGIRVAFRTCRAEDEFGGHAPNLYFIGPLTFGTHFYTNSFTTNRVNASRVAGELEHLVAGRRGGERHRRFDRRSAIGAGSARKAADG